MRGRQKNKLIEDEILGLFDLDAELPDKGEDRDGRDGRDGREAREDPWISTDDSRERTLDMHWHSLERNTKKTMKTALKYWLTWIEECGTDGLVHPITKVVQFLDWLKDHMVAKGSRDPAGTVENARNALYRLRMCQRGIPNPEFFSEHPLMRHACKKARKATFDYRTSDENDRSRLGFNATSLTRAELQELIDAAINYASKPGGDALTGITVAAMVGVGTMAGLRGDDLCGLKYATLSTSNLTEVRPTPMTVVHMALNDGKTNKEGWLQYTGIARHKDPLMDIQGLIAEKVVYDLLVAHMDIASPSARMIYRHSSTANQKQKYDDLYGMFMRVMDTVSFKKSKALHLFRDTGVILLAQGGVSMDTIRIWGHWLGAYGAMGSNYIEKNPLAALDAYAVLAGWPKDFYQCHELDRASKQVPKAWTAFAAHASPAIKYLIEVFWQNMPYKIARYSDGPEGYYFQKIPFIRDIVAGEEYRVFAGLAAPEPPPPDLDPEPVPYARPLRIEIPLLFSNQVKTIEGAWVEWTDVICPKLAALKADPTMKLGDRNVKALSKNRHLPEYIEKHGEAAIAAIAALERAQSAHGLTLSQMRDAMRMLASKTADLSAIIHGSKVKLRDVAAALGP
jgi:hypothetical protein